MLTRMRSKLTYANVMSSIAVFIVLGGVAWAQQQIGTNDIQHRAVTEPKIANNAVGPRALGNNAVRPWHINRNAVRRFELAPRAVRPWHIRRNAVRRWELQGNAVHTWHITRNAVKSWELAPDAVQSSHIGDGAVGAAQFTATINRQESFTVADNSSATQSVACQREELLISGGGGFIDALEDDPNLSVQYSAPLLPGRDPLAWVVRVRNDTGTAQEFFVSALCLQ
jgi:hypothetical protein